MMSGYKSLFFKIGTVIFIFGICLLFSFLIVYPLWSLATQHTHIYTAASLVFFSVLLLSFLIKKNIKEYRRNPKHFFHSLIKKLIILGGLALFFCLAFCLSANFCISCAYCEFYPLRFCSVRPFRRSDLALLHEKDRALLYCLLFYSYYGFSSVC